MQLRPSRQTGRLRTAVSNRLAPGDAPRVADRAPARSVVGTGAPGVARGVGARPEAIAR